MKLFAKTLLGLVISSIFIIIIFYSMFLLNTSNLTAVLVDTAEIISNTTTKEGKRVLNTQAEIYLRSVAKELSERIENYLNERKSDIRSLTVINKTADSFLTFSLSHSEEIHRRANKAPVEGVSFPYEANISDVEKVPAFKRLIYVSENGTEIIKIENNEVKTNLRNVSNTELFRETKKLKEGEMYVLKKGYTIWDCSERYSTLIGEPLYKIQSKCPRKEIMNLNITNWQRFREGCIRYSMADYENGVLKGIIVADVDFLPLMMLINDVQLGKTGYAFLQQSIVGTKAHDRGEGITVAHPSHQFVLYMDPASLYQLNASGLDDLRVLAQKQHRGEDGLGNYLFRGLNKYTAYAAYNETDIHGDAVIWSVGLTSPVEEFSAPMNDLKQKQSFLIAKIKMEIMNITNSFFLSTVFWMIFILIIAVLFLLLFQSKTILLPLMNLRNGFSEICRGNLDVKLYVKSRDEIGELASEFNEMAEKLKKSRLQLEEYSKNLEKKVKKRTKELNERLLEIEKTKTATFNMMEDLSESLEKQKNLERIKTEFLTVTSHELRTPITPMKSEIEMNLAGFYGKLKNEQEKSLELVRRNIIILDTLISDILDISKLQSGNLKFIMAKADMNKIVQETIDTLKIKSNEKNIKMDYKSTNIKQLKKVIIDENRIRQVVTNLINNAIKFTDTNGSILVTLSMSRGRVVFSVKDSGIGISAKDQERIFNPFEQVDSSMSRHYEGSGLGLAICKGIINAHMGRIFVESEIGKGSTFTFTLPTSIKKKKVSMELLE